VNNNEKQWIVPTVNQAKVQHQHQPQILAIRTIVTPDSGTSSTTPNIIECKCIIEANNGRFEIILLDDGFAVGRCGKLTLLRRAIGKICGGIRMRFFKLPIRVDLNTKC
jgi:hypothetical protein